MKSLMLLFLAVLGGVAIVLIGYQAPPSLAPPAAAAEPATVVLEEGGRESVDGLPVPIYPGSRVTEAELLPPRTSKAEPRVVSISTAPPEALSRRDARPKPDPGPRSVAGRLSATPERARADARLQLQREIVEWLVGDVPAHWRPPAELLDRVVVRTQVNPVVRDYGTLYEATQVVDFSPTRRAEVVEAYQREVVAHRLTILGGALGFTLICLAALSGYIRADEATKGYYTNWLRAVAAAGVGASGVLLYQLLA